MTETNRTVRCSLLVSTLMLAATARAQPAEQGLVVETGSPDALCPDLRMTREAIQSRLGTLALDGDQHGWTARYTAGHAPGSTGDFVRIELFDPSGTRRLVRDLPRAGESCATLSQAIALVVERYFRELAPAPASEPATADLPPPNPLVSVPAAPERVGPRLGVGLAFGFYSAQPGAVAGLQVGYWLAPSLHIELALSADLAAHSEQLGSALVELRSFPAELAVGVGQRWRTLEFFAGPELRVTLEDARGVALRSFRPTPGAQVSAGAGIGLDWWPTGVLGLSLRASGDYVLTSTKFRVEAQGAPPRQVLALSPFQLLTTVGVIWRTSP